MQIGLRQKNPDFERPIIFGSSYPLLKEHH